MMKKDKLLFANLTAKETFLEQGRIFFSILNTFSHSGYKIFLLKNDTIFNSGKYGDLTFSLQNLSVIDSKPEAPENYTFLFDYVDKQLNKLPWGKKINLKYDIYSPYWLKHPIIMPFPVHPLQEVQGSLAKLPELRNTQRQFQILFAGDSNNYKRKWVNYPQEKLSRLEIIDTIKEKLSSKLIVVDDEKSYTTTMNTQNLDKFVLIDNEQQRLDSHIWLDTLAKSNFFLCPPGIIMSMCHNLVEAMAVGCIPITNYPEWFHPNLKHGVNCIVFSDENDMLEQINSIFSMSEEEINLMKRNAIEYYESYLKKEAFIKEIEEDSNKSQTVLYFTERYVFKNNKKLNKHSILMRDTSIPAKKTGIKYQLNRLLESI
ncbi:MAG: hypothetical protein GQ583_08475 [Methyloprofundus sp.]|nr:hypothetical protein [Methyloprofundus sp.]